MDDELKEIMIDINIIAIIKGTNVALLYMSKQNGGSIAHIASIVGFFPTQ